MFLTKELAKKRAIKTITIPAFIDNQDVSFNYRAPLTKQIDKVKGGNDEEAVRSLIIDCICDEQGNPMLTQEDIGEIPVPTLITIMEEMMADMNKRDKKQGEA